MEATEVVPSRHKLYKGAYNSVTLSQRLSAHRRSDTPRMSGIPPTRHRTTATAITDRPLQYPLQATKRQWRP